MNRAELVSQRHAARVERGVDTHVLEAPEAEQVRDRVAHLRHRQRLADARFEHLEQNGSVEVASFDLERGPLRSVCRCSRHDGTARGAAEQREHSIIISGRGRRIRTRASHALRGCSVWSSFRDRIHESDRSASVLEQDDLIVGRRAEAP